MLHVLLHMKSFPQSLIFFLLYTTRNTRMFPTIEAMINARYTAILEALAPGDPSYQKVGVIIEDVLLTVKFLLFIILPRVLAFM